MKAFILCVMLCCSSAAAQHKASPIAKPAYQGQFKVKAGEVFTIHEAWMPMDMGRIYDTAIYITDNALNRITRSTPHIFRVKTDPAIGGTYIDFTATMKFDSAGVFKVVREIDYLQRTGTRKQYKEYWRFDVTSPIVDPKIDSTGYYPNETGFINFAAGHAEYNHYSYRVYSMASPEDRDTTGKQIVSGTGPVVPVEQITCRPSVLAFGDTVRCYKIIGLYHDDQFHYRRSAADTVLWPSEWTIAVKKPELVSWNNWSSPDEFSANIKNTAWQKRHTLDLRSDSPFNLSKFRFAYFARKDDAKFIYIQPIIDEFNVEIEGKVKCLVASSYPSQSEGFYETLILTRNESVGLPPDGVPITVTISFNTQYETRTERYKAIVRSFPP